MPPNVGVQPPRYGVGWDDLLGGAATEHHHLHTAAIALADSA